jgi:ABC-type nitrate/sulfonate/bicarbonate transport system permease component
MSERIRPIALGTLSFAVILLVWQGLVDFGIVDAFLVASPTRVASALWDQAQSGILWRNVKASGAELLIAMVIATAIGIPLGIVIGWYRRVGRALDPLVWLQYSTPIIALYPIFTLMFGLGSNAVIAMTVLLTVSPIIINTTRGVRSVDRKLIQAARSFGAGDRQLFVKVVLPASLPLVMAGMRLAVGRALIGVAVGELFAGTKGLGWSVSYYGGLLQTTDMLASVVVIAALGVLLTSVVGVVERRLDSWRVDVAS